MDELDTGIDGDSTEITEEPLIGTLDIILLVILALGGLYYFLFRGDDKKKKDLYAQSFTISNAQLPTKLSDGGIIDKMKASGKNVIIYYGSQTGTAEEFAGRLSKDTARYGLKAMVADPEECDMTELSRLSEIENHLAIFVMATYGEGDPTDNAQEFYELLQNGDLELEGVKYTVFGLGNKTYEHYNATAKYVDKRLNELGAERIFEAGVGDDDANMEDDFITWKDNLWRRVCDIYGLEASAMDINIRQYALKVFEDYNPDKVFKGEIGRLGSNKLEKQKPPFDSKNPFMSKIVVIRELHKAGDRNCLHIELNIKDSRIRYDAGDHVAIYPVNDSKQVQHLLSLCDQDPELVFSLINVDEDSSKRVPFPCPCSSKTAFTHYVDISSIPRTHVLKELAEYATEPEEKAKLLLMSSATEEGKAEYHKWIVQDCRSIVQILEDLPSCKPAADHLCELLPRLQARYYSISSTPKVSPTAIHVTAVVLKYETPIGRSNKGVCTNWLLGILNQQPQEIYVPIFVRKSQFRLPNRTHVPVIMIGPGTGIAPFRGFIQERNFYKKDKEVAETIMYFGCRHQKEDYIYEEEMKEYVDNGVLQLHAAFSRDQPEKVYVTHLLQKNKAAIWDIIGEKKGHLYVCGDAKYMANDVQKVIVSLCQSEGGLNADESEAFVKKMVTQRRYSSDVWS